MKKLMALAIGVMTLFSTLPLHAAEVTFSGEFRVRGFWTDNLTDGNSGGGAAEDMSRFNDQRFRLKTTIKAGVSTGVVVLDFGNCLFGTRVATFNNPFGGGGLTGDCRFGRNGFGGSFNTVGVREAYLHINLSKVGLILGRQTIKLGHGIVLDDTVDAVTVVLPLNGATVTGSMLQLADLNDAIAPGIGLGINQDTTIWLVNVGMDHRNHVINLYDALLYSQSPSFTARRTFIYPTGVTSTPGLVVCFFPSPGCLPDKIWLNVVGASLDIRNGPMTLAFEGSYAIGQASNWTLGQDARLKGWNVMGDATVDAGGAKAGGTIVYASGQEPTAVNDINVTDISGNFQLGNILLNNEQRSDRDGSSLGGGFGGLGIVAVKLHADLMPVEKLTVGGAAIYARTEQLCVACNERTIGYEFDANAKYVIDDNLAFHAGAGYLITADGARDFYSGLGGGGPANSNLWKLSAKAVFTF
jgi:hypothetical protein